MSDPANTAHYEDVLQTPVRNAPVGHCRPAGTEHQATGTALGSWDHGGSYQTPELVLQQLGGTAQGGLR